MKKFKQYIKETPSFNDVEKEDKSPYSEPLEDKRKRENLGELRGHKVSKLSYNKGYWSHYAVHEPDGKISLGVFGRQEGDKFHVSNLNGYQNKVKAHELYHHLITKNDVHLHSDTSLSPGAFKVWEKLHQHPDIKMQTYDTESKSYTDIPKDRPLAYYMKNDNVKFAAHKNDS